MGSYCRKKALETAGDKRRNPNYFFLPEPPPSLTLRDTPGEVGDFRARAWTKTPTMSTSYKEAVLRRTAPTMSPPGCPKGESLARSAKVIQ
jgi:hypothetical protein